MKRYPILCEMQPKKKKSNAMLSIKVQTTSQDNIPDSLPENIVQIASQDPKNDPAR